MIISHQHRYLFVEHPRTGTTAISKELVTQYDGKRILKNHSTYRDFLGSATDGERKYFVFTTVRNPLDNAVSHYFKLLTDHREYYSERMKNKKFLRIPERIDWFLFNYIQNKQIDFPTFFRRFYVLPYDNWASTEKEHYDYVMRFENLQDDFDTVLRKIGLEPTRPLPPRNVTGARQKEFFDYYTPEIIPQAKRVFGPFMRYWGYQFPTGWGEVEVPWWNRLELNFFNIFRKAYWYYFRQMI